MKIAAGISIFRAMFFPALSLLLSVALIFTGVACHNQSKTMKELEYDVNYARVTIKAFFNSFPEDAETARRPEVMRMVELRAQHLMECGNYLIDKYEQPSGVKTKGQ